jgi:maltose-binding protein MalE
MGNTEHLASEISRSAGSYANELLADKKNKKSDIEVYQNTFPEVISKDNIINNNIFGLPLSSDTLQLYYNTNLYGNVYSKITKTGNVSDSDRQIFTKGPINWDQFVRAVQLITQKNGSTITQSGVALGTSNITNANDILTIVMLQNGAKMTSDDLASAQFQTSQNIFGGNQYPGTKALDFYTSFANPGNANYTWNDSLGDSVRAFAEGKTAMMIGYKSQESDIKRINPNTNYQIINLPQIKETKNPVNYASYNTYTITKASKNSALAWNFLLASKDVSENLIQSIPKNSAILTAKSWYIPDPIKTPELFKQMIKTVNDNGNSQTAIENAASQVTTLLQALKK